VTHGIEVSVLQRLRRREPLLVVIPQQPVKEVDCICVRQVLVFCRNELLPGRARVTAEDGVEFAVEPNSILIEVPDAV
jgi:hypothetical protein